MALAVALQANNSPDIANPLSNRNEVLARYRKLREISVRQHHEILELISRDTLLKQARRLDLAQGKTLIFDDMEEMYFVFDLLIHTASAGRTRAIDRYARSVRLAPQSDEALALEAMRAACFSILAIKQRHETAGLIATDLFRHEEVWLVDIGLESSMPDGSLIATRYYTPEEFSMTTGVFVPFDVDMLEDVIAELPRHLHEIELVTLMDDRRFAEAIYRIALWDGITDRVGFLDLPDNS